MNGYAKSYCEKSQSALGRFAAASGPKNLRGRLAIVEDAIVHSACSAVEPPQTLQDTLAS
jgi:hypothetical protein